MTVKLARRLPGLIWAVLAAACQSPAAVIPSQPMPVGHETAAPFGHVDFCTRLSGECVEDTGATATALRLSKSRVNREANQAIRPITDLDLYQTKELWTYPDEAGDCEDFALLKRRQLIAAGWPRSALLLTVAYDTKDNAHAVLIAATDRGDYVLDNRTDDVLPWMMTNYRWSMRQSAANETVWLRLLAQPASSGMTASVSGGSAEPPRVPNSD